MSTFLTNLPEFSMANLLHLFIIFLVALLLNRLLRVVTKLIIKPAATQTRAAQAREQQTRTLSGVVFSAGSKIVWAIALLTAAQEFGINVTPVAALAGLASLAVGFGAQNLVRDIITGFYIILEDQYVVGDTIQVGDTVGRVEHLTLRRTVVRDPRGALVTLSNGDIRTLANLSRDWSQAFVDVSVSPLVPQEQAFSLSKRQSPICATMRRGLKPWSTGPAFSVCSPMTNTPPQCAFKSAPLRLARTMWLVNCAAVSNSSFRSRIFRCLLSSDWNWLTPRLGKMSLRFRPLHD